MQKNVEANQTYRSKQKINFKIKMYKKNMKRKKQKKSQKKIKLRKLVKSRKDKIEPKMIKCMGV